MGFTVKVASGEFLETHNCTECDAPCLTYAGPFLKGSLYPLEPLFTCDCDAEEKHPQFWMSLDTFIVGPTIYS